MTSLCCFVLSLHFKISQNLLPKIITFIPIATIFPLKNLRDQIASKPLTDGSEMPLCSLSKCDNFVMNSCNCLVVCCHWSWCSWVCLCALIWCHFGERFPLLVGWIIGLLWNIHISSSSKTVETPSFWKIGRLPNHLGITLFMHYPYASRNECQITNTVLEPTYPT